jgi:hypothetical protein
MYAGFERTLKLMRTLPPNEDRVAWTENKVLSVLGTLSALNLLSQNFLLKNRPRSLLQAELLQKRFT